MDLLNKVKWDRRINSNLVSVVYEDRIKGLVVVPFSNIRELTDQFFYTDVGKIPLHRIRQIRYNGVTIFDLEHARNVWNRAKVSQLRYIPTSKLSTFDWSLDIIDIDRVTLDANRLKQVEHQVERIEFQRRLLLTGVFSPVIVVYHNFFLLDGYARYLAFKELRIPLIPAYLGIPRERVIWDWKERREVNV